MTQRFDVGLQLLRQKQYDRAAGAFLDVVRENPTHPQAWSNYGIALVHAGRAAEAEAALSKAIALSPDNFEAWFHLGVARSEQEEWGDAVGAYRHAVGLTPGDVVAWHRLGVALAESGDEAAASVAFERALVLSREPPSPEDVQESLATPLVIDDHSEEGGEREGVREAKSWLDLALSLLTLGDEEEAVAAYERAYTLDPERASHSLFKPMLQLLASADPGAPDGPAPPGAEGAPALGGPPRPEAVRPPTRPEVG
jgi:Flp pilus assembly protein TadD